MIWDEYQRFAYESGWRHGFAGYDCGLGCDRFYRLGWEIARGAEITSPVPVIYGVYCGAM